jgi:large subunit ribosomal protein L15
MLHNLTSIVKRGAKRVGRGSSSGKGKTAGRGQKGQKARNKVPWFMTGGSRRSRFSKSLPQVRGYRNRAVGFKAYTIPSSVLEKFYKSGEVVTLENLIERGIVSERDAKRGVKIVRSSEMKIKLKFEVPASKSLSV